MLTFPNQLGSRQGQVTHFSHQLMTLYQDSKLERKQVTTDCPGSDDEFSILEELEMLTIAISGYATQIQSTETIKNTVKAIVDLQKLNVFENAVVSQFYQDAGSDYPKLQAYIQLLDYLRLLSLEYLQSVDRPYSISA
jgi:hypothetical protein